MQPQVFNENYKPDVLENIKTDKAKNLLFDDLIQIYTEQNYYRQKKIDKIIEYFFFIYERILYMILTFYVQS